MPTICLHVRKSIPILEKLRETARSQEAITTVYSAREDFLNAAKEEIERRYGDVETYLERGIGLKKEEIKKLQSILLVKNDN